MMDTFRFNNNNYYSLTLHFNFDKTELQQMKLAINASLYFEKSLQCDPGQMQIHKSGR